jgi:prepilin-type N-terminal cleavage/methylation domain-containing protein
MHDQRLRSKSCSAASRRRHGAAVFARGFTLLEILLVILLIGLVGAVLIGGSAQLLNEKPVAAEDVFWSAVQHARKAALVAEHDVRLKFDSEKKRFLLFDGTAAPLPASPRETVEEVPLQEFPIPSATPDLAVDFLVQAKGGNAILVGGVLVESQPIPYVTFYGDGTCTAFRLQIFRTGGAHVLTVDPWTCAPMLETKAGS